MLKKEDKNMHVKLIRAKVNPSVGHYKKFQAPQMARILLII